MIYIHISRYMRPRAQVALRWTRWFLDRASTISGFIARASPAVSICQHTSAYVSILQHTSAYISTRKHHQRLHRPRLIQ